MLWSYFDLGHYISIFYYIYHSVSEACSNHNVISDTTRFFHYNETLNNCDSTLAEGWYMFEINGNPAEIPRNCLRVRENVEMSLHDISTCCIIKFVYLLLAKKNIHKNVDLFCFFCFFFFQPKLKPLEYRLFSIIKLFERAHDCVDICSIRQFSLYFMFRRGNMF